MSNVWKMLFFTVMFATVLVGFVAVRPYIVVDHGTCSAKNACIANMKQLEGATAVWALDHGKQTNDMPTWSDIIGETNYISKKPICPEGGTYTLGALGQPPRCTITNHVLPP